MTGIERIRKVLTSTIIEHPNNVVFGTDYAIDLSRYHIVGLLLVFGVSLRASLFPWS